MRCSKLLLVVNLIIALGFNLKAQNKNSVVKDPSKDLSFKSIAFGKEIHRTASLSAGDIDNDGDLDVVAANGRHWPEQDWIFLNDGKGMFSRSFPLDTVRDSSYAAELADLDGDGDLDIAVCNDEEPNLIYSNNSQGSFVKKLISVPPYSRPQFKSSRH